MSFYFPWLIPMILPSSLAISASATPPIQPFGSEPLTSQIPFVSVALYGFSFSIFSLP
jgi:hypothetical protein